MKYRIAGWAIAGLLIAGGWGVYFAKANKEIRTDPIVYLVARLTCPIGFLGTHFAISVSGALVANFVTYAVIGTAVEVLRRQLRRAR